MREPNILIIGRNSRVITVLVDELKRYGRNSLGTSNKESVERILKNATIDFVVISESVEAEAREAVQTLISTIYPNLPVYSIEYSLRNQPSRVVTFINDKALEFKINRVLTDKAI